MTLVIRISVCVCVLPAAVCSSSSLSAQSLPVCLFISLACSFCDRSPQQATAMPCHLGCVMWAQAAGETQTVDVARVIISLPEARVTRTASSHLLPLSWPAPWAFPRRQRRRCSWLLVRTLSGATSESLCQRWLCQLPGKQALFWKLVWLLGE